MWARLCNMLEIYIEVSLCGQQNRNPFSFFLYLYWIAEPWCRKSSNVSIKYCHFSTWLYLVSYIGLLMHLFHMTVFWHSVSGFHRIFQMFFHMLEDVLVSVNILEFHCLLDCKNVKHAFWIYLYINRIIYISARCELLLRCYYYLIREFLEEKRRWRSEAVEVPVVGGTKMSQNRRVSSATADTTVTPSGLYSRKIQETSNFFSCKFPTGFNS